MKKQKWEQLVQFSVCSDGLAKLGLNSEMDFQELAEPPPCLVQTLSDNFSGVARARLVVP